MITPTMQAFGTFALNTMQAMLDDITTQSREAEEERTGKKADPLTQAKISASEEAKRSRDNISEALFSVTKVDTQELKVQLFAKLGESLGIEQTDDMSGYAYGRAIEQALDNMDSTATRQVAEKLGLKDLDISLETLIEAIKNPFSDASEKLDKALERVHGGGKTTETERAKVLQRLEDVADPKSLEELKLGEQGTDPTRVEDEETRQERRDDIVAKEAGAKLDDVQDMQKAIAERNEAGASNQQTPSSKDSYSEADVLLTVLAAASQSASDVDLAASDDKAAADNAEGQDPVLAEPDSNGEATDEQQQIQDLQAAEAEMQLTPDDETASMPISSDELGIYALLTRNQQQKQYGIQ